jgi:nucleoside-diphosphate-sugar epimerase
LHQRTIAEKSISFENTLKDLKKIGIIGCGWLGQKLAGHFAALGFPIYTTNTSAEKTEGMRKEGFTSFMVNFPEDRLQDYETEIKPAHTTFDKLDIIIICINMSKTKELQLQMNLFQNVLSFLGNKHKQLFLMSSIGIYPQSKQVIDEHTFPTEQLHARLHKIEEVFLKNLPSINILRLGGLMGDNRMFYKYYRKESSNEVVNHIHYEDICRVIEKMMLLGLKGKIYNVVAPLHPTKGEVYAYQTKTVIDASLVSQEENRTISSDKMIRELGYAFVFPDPKTFA